MVLPYARPGIIGGCFLALGRALGETMAVTMLIGNYRGISLSPFGKGNSIPSVIANEFTEATYDLYLSVAGRTGPGAAAGQRGLQRRRPAADLA